MTNFAVFFLLVGSIVACRIEPDEPSQEKSKNSRLNIPGQPASPSISEKSADQPLKPLEVLMDKSGNAVFELSTSNTQGIAGRVTKTSGDCQPPLSFATTCRTDMVITRVYLFEGDVSAGSVLGAVPKLPLLEGLAHPGYLGSIETDRGGRYAVGLPPGSYTILAEFDGFLYLNSFVKADPMANPGTMRLVYTSIAVEASKTTIFDINNTEDASF